VASSAAGGHKWSLDSDLVLQLGGLSGDRMRRVESKGVFSGRSQEGSVVSGTSKDVWSASLRCSFSDGDGDVEFHTAPVKTCVPFAVISSG
jgi:hypothetical protein